MKKVILATTALTVAAGFAGTAHAVNVEMYGQVNKSAMMMDNGDSTRFAVTDNDFSSTRFGVRGSQVLANGLTASVLLETEIQDNPSNQATIADAVNGTVTNDKNTFTTRHARVGLAGNWGALFVGKTSTATDGVTEVDLGAAQDVTGSAMSRIGGGITPHDATNTAGALVNYIDNMNGLDFAGRTGTATDGFNDRFNTLRYDSPIVEGFQGRVAATSGDDMDVAVYYNGKFDAFAVAGGIGYAKFNNYDPTGTGADADDQWSGSVSVKHDSGISGTIAYGTRSYNAASRDDSEMIYAKLGYDWKNWGFAGEYGNYDKVGDSTVADNSVDAYGLAAQYDLGHGVSVAGYWKEFDLDLASVDTDKVDVYGLNMRVKF